MMIKLVTSLALMASAAQATNPTQAEIAAYVTAQELLDKWDRTQSCDFTLSDSTIATVV